MKVEIIKENGSNYIAVCDRIIDTLAFKSFRPTRNNVGDFYKRGVRIFHVYCTGMKSGISMLYSLYGEPWVGDRDYRFEVLDRQMEFFIENAPDAYLFVNLQLDTRDWWLDQHSGLPSSFTHLSQVAASEEFRRDTAEFLRAFITYAEEKYGDRILGYFLTGGHTNEWLSDFDYEASHPVKLRAYRQYTTDATAVIPDADRLIRPSNEIFLDPVADGDVIRYRRFHAELVSDTILYFCAEAQSVLHHNKLLGVFFGYVMELDGERMWNAGHLDLDRVNQSDDIDLIATPSSYRFRQYDDAGAHMTLDDSLRLSGKVYFASFDNLTCTVPTLESNPRRIAGDKSTEEALYQLVHKFKRLDTLETAEKTIAGMRREMMLRLSKMCGTWWFDMLEGWYYDDRLMDEVERLTALSDELLKLPMKSASEIAFIVSCESLYYVNKCSDINTELLTDQRDALSRIGAPYDIYSISDLERISRDQYKLYVFPDAFYLSNKDRDYIKNVLMKDGRSVLFVGAAGYVSGERLSYDGISDLIGMRVKRLEIDEARACAFGSEYGYKSAKSPTFAVCDGGEVLGRFIGSGECALAAKSGEDYTIYYSSIGNLSRQTLREIAERAGVHMYSDCGVPVYVNSELLGVYNTGSETTAVYPLSDGEYVDIFSCKKYKTEKGRLLLDTGVCPACMLKKL